VLAAVLASGSSGEQAAQTQAKHHKPRVRVKTVTTTQITTAQGEMTTVYQTTTAVTLPTTLAATTPPTNAGSGTGGNGRSAGELVSYDEAVNLTDQATGYIRAGDYRSALPAALQAYQSLRGSGDIYEAYAAYDAGNSYVRLGDCKRGLPLLDASEQIQGPKQPINAARAQCE